jgi:hypothetical protein
MPWTHMGEWSYDSTIPDFGNRWRWVVSFTTLQLYRRGNSSPYPLDRRLGGPQSRSGRCGEEKDLATAGNRTPILQPVAYRYSDWAIPRTIWHKHLRAGYRIIETNIEFKRRFDIILASTSLHMIRHLFYTTFDGVRLSELITQTPACRVGNYVLASQNFWITTGD